jgi:UDP-3-O-[3-hydroxymyristoyl] glucosamine N-acyltransferase
MPTVEALAGEFSGEIWVCGNMNAIADKVSAASMPERNSLVFLKPDQPELCQQLLSLDYPLVVICDEMQSKKLSQNPAIALLVTEQPRFAFMTIASRFFGPKGQKRGIHDTASVDPSAKVDASASIGPMCVIGENCAIGANTVLHAHVVLYDRVIVGNNVVVHASTVIGSDGFGYERSPNGEMVKFPHLGGVIIEDHVEIGSNTSIDRGSLSDTIIRKGAKIDNQVHIAHNCDIGADAVVIAQTMVGGSVKIGAKAWIAPAAVLLNQIEIGAGGFVALGAVVTKSVMENETVIGAPAVPEAEFKASRNALKRLADEI